MEKPVQTEESHTEKRRSFGKRIAEWFNNINNRGYIEHVPEPLRELGESRGAPLPERYVPSIHGTPSRMPNSEK